MPMTPSSFVARFGQSKVGTVGLISSGVKKRGANVLDAGKINLEVHCLTQKKTNVFIVCCFEVSLQYFGTLPGTHWYIALMFMFNLCTFIVS